MNLKINKTQWLHIGKQAGWVKEDQMPMKTKVINIGWKDKNGRPIYKDENGKVYVDVNLGRNKSPELRSVSKSGEPLDQLEQFVIVDEFKNKY